MAQSRHEATNTTNLNALSDLVRQGQYEEIKKLLQQKEMKTKFSGETVPLLPIGLLFHPLK